MYVIPGFILEINELGETDNFTAGFQKPVAVVLLA